MSSLTSMFQAVDWFETIRYLIGSCFAPIVIAFITYILVDKLGEYKKRRAYSLLGVSIIESLQEEVSTGIQIMKDEIKTSLNGDDKWTLDRYLPNRSWNGMTTINDDILLRIIETSRGMKFDGLPPKQCRTHCKNYFEHMNKNFNQIIENVNANVNERQEWRAKLRTVIGDETKGYLHAAINVYNMLENAKLLLEHNAKIRRPK